MTKHYRKMIVHGDHLESSSPPWTVLWQIKQPLDDSWSSAEATSEQAAIDRATHFMRLGFVVHAIKNPSGAVVMDQAWIAPASARFQRSGQTDPPRSEAKSRTTLISSILLRRPDLRRSHCRPSL